MENIKSSIKILYLPVKTHKHDVNEFSFIFDYFHQSVRYTIHWLTHSFILTNKEYSPTRILFPF